MSDLYSFHATTIDGVDRSLADFKGDVLLIVNVASQCGFTPQYKGLEEMYRKHKSEGFQILGFPCDQFGKQEPGSNEEIMSFCSRTFGVSFPMFTKIEVNGPKAHPLYEYLKNTKPGIFGTKAIKWNFAKFLVDRAGKVVKRYSMFATPTRIERDVERLLKSPNPA